MLLMNCRRFGCALLDSSSDHSMKEAGNDKHDLMSFRFYVSVLVRLCICVHCSHFTFGHTWTNFPVENKEKKTNKQNDDVQEITAFIETIVKQIFKNGDVERTVLLFS